MPVFVIWTTIFFILGGLIFPYVEPRANVSIDLELATASKEIFNFTVCVGDDYDECSWTSKQSFKLLYDFFGTKKINLNFLVDSVENPYSLNAKLEKNGQVISTFLNVGFRINRKQMQILNSNSGTDKRLHMTVTYSCAEHYYGPKCDVICFNTEYQSCGPDGKKLCHFGYYWKKELCYRNACLTDTVLCHNGGTCQNVDDEFKCICKEDYQGPHCKEWNPCYNYTCHNGGRCVKNSLKRIFYCRCRSGFSGAQCLTRTGGSEHEDKGLSTSFRQPSLAPSRNMTSASWNYETKKPSEHPEVIIPKADQGGHRSDEFYQVTMTTFSVIGAFCVVVILLIAVSCYFFKSKRKRRSPSSFTLPTEFGLTPVYGDDHHTLKRCYSFDREPFCQHLASSPCLQLCEETHHQNGGLHPINNLSRPSVTSEEENFERLPFLRSPDCCGCEGKASTLGRCTSIGTGKAYDCGATSTLPPPPRKIKNNETCESLIKLNNDTEEVHFDK